jgi:hypothetical protein
MSDITFCLDGTLYGVASSGSHWLYRINLATGAASKVGTGSDATFGGGGLACEAATIYNMEAAKLFSFGTSGNRALISTSLPVAMDSADFWQGTLYAVNTDKGIPASTRLVTIDTATGATTFLSGSNSVNNLDGIAFEPMAIGTE